MKTSVVNSRGSKKTVNVWRRRKCPKCNTIFTTIESPVVSGITVASSHNETNIFSKPRLAMNIAGYLASEPSDTRADTAFWLATTVEQKMITNELTSIEKSQLTQLVQKTLAGYDPTAGILYGTNYGLINPLARARRGRPSYL